MVIPALAKGIPSDLDRMGGGGGGGHWNTYCHIDLYDFAYIHIDKQVG